MTRFGFWIPASLVVVSLAFFSGCEQPPAPAPDAHDHDHGDDGHDHGDHADDDEHGAHDDHGDDHSHGEHSKVDPAEIEANLAKLSDEDRTAAEKQKVCLVGGEALGAMGAPVKVTVEGQDVFICCESCRDALTKDPQKFLANLKTE